ncbi:hypothetical protein [Pyrobaculum sp.]|uniref:hypothetical protein n=1 Tax=Pyrobaculum sp. TaxID=2004705 RepID=UPI003D0CEDD2
MSFRLCEAVSQFDLPHVRVYVCSDGRYVYALRGEVWVRGLTVESWKGIPVRALLDVYASAPATVVLAAQYGDTARAVALDLPAGPSTVSIAPASSRGGRLVRVDVYGYDGELRASATPAERPTGLELEEVYVATEDTPLSGFAFSTTEAASVVSPLVSASSREARFVAIKGGVASGIVAQNNRRFAFFTGSPSNVRYGFPYVVSTVPGGAPATAAGLLDLLTSLPGAALSFFSGLAGQVQKVGEFLWNSGGALLNAVSSSLQAIGSTLSGVAYSAYKWATETRVQLGPFSVSVLDIGLTVASVLVPVGVAGLVARGALGALSALGFTGAAAAVASRVVGGLAGGAVAYVLGKASGEGDLAAVYDAVATFALPFFSSVKAVAAAVAGGFLISFLDRPPGQEELGGQGEVEKAELATGRALNQMCFDPYLSTLPVTECKKALSASSTPIASILEVRPLAGSEILSPSPTVAVANFSKSSGVFELVVRVGLDTVWRGQVYLPAGGTTEVQVGNLKPGTVTISLLYNGVEVDRRVYRYSGGGQLDTDKLATLIALAALVSVVSSISRR